MKSARVPAFATACLLLVASLAAAQPESFGEALTDFAQQVKPPNDANDAKVAAAIDRLTGSLGRWDAVIVKMEQGLAAEIGRAPRPAAARMRATLGTAYIERGRFADALRELDLAVTLEPTLAVTHTLRGIALEWLRRPRDSRAAFARAWQYGQDVPTAAQFLRSARQGSPAPPAADVARARAVLAAAVDKAVASPPVMLEFLTLKPLDIALEAALYAPAAFAPAFALIADARLAEGIAALRSAAASPVVREGARTEFAQLEAIEALIGKGDVVAAVKALQSAADAFPQSWQVRWRLGTLLERLGDGAGAVRALQAAAKIRGTPALYEALGRLHHAQLDLTAAAAAYEKELELLPSAPHYGLGMVYRDMGQLDDAITEFAISALVHPDDERVFAELGQIYAATGDDARAVRLLRYALAGEPGLIAARYALSRALLRLGQREEAARELETFQQQQRKAMEDERRRFEENSKKIDEVLRDQK